MPSRRPLLGVALLLAACADEPVDVGAQHNPSADEVDAAPEIPGPRVEFVDLADWLPAETTTRVLATAPEGVVRVELYLDGARIADLLFAPFELTWNTRPFGEGAHELRALAYLADGGTAEVSRLVAFDHTPPVASLPEQAGYPAPFAVAASDEPSGVAQVVLTGDDGAPRVLTEAPYDYEWSGGCGDERVKVAVVDRAGNQVLLERPYYAGDTRDADCDGHRALAFPGGDDCNDASWDVHPGVVDKGEIGVDLDCDGVPGVDADGDGVASTSTHGSDCDDAEPAVHGPVLEWWAPFVTPSIDPTHFNVAVVQDGDRVGVVHQAMEAGLNRLVWTSRAVTGDETFALDGEIIAETTAVVTALAAAPGPVVAYGQGPALRLARRGASGWSVEDIAVLAEGDAVHDLQLAVDSTGAVHAAYAVWHSADGQTVLHQARQQAGGWEVESVEAVSGGWLRLAVDSDGVPAVLYPVNGYYRYTRGFGATRSVGSVSTAVGPAFAADLRASSSLPGGLEIYAISRFWWQSGQAYLYRGESLEQPLETLVAQPLTDPYAVAVGRDAVAITGNAGSYMLRDAPAGFAWQALPGGLKRTGTNGPLVSLVYLWPHGVRLVVPTGYREGAGCL